MNRFTQLFGNSRPIIAMLHLKSNAQADMMTRARKEIEMYFQCGVDAVLVENYFGSAQDCEKVLAYLQAEYPDKPYGVNVLGDWQRAFRLAGKYAARFLQIDSVCGHLPHRQDLAFAEELRAARLQSDAAVLGGVRFKYQPVRSGRSLQADLQLGMERCDAIVVTGEGTGLPTPPSKLYEFRAIVGDFPLLVGAGVTAGSIAATMQDAQGAIIGSWFKENHRDTGDTVEAYIREIVERTDSVRRPRRFPDFSQAGL